MSDQRSITLVVGGTGAGKSELVTGKDGHVDQPLISEMPGPIFLLDTQAEFNFGVIYTGEGHPERHPVSQMVDKLLSGETTAYRRHVVRPHPLAEHETQMAQCRDFFRVLDNAGFSGTIVIDETHLFSSASAAIQPIKNMVLMGRHSGQHLIFTAKRTTLVSKNLVSEADVVIHFANRYEPDIRRLSETLVDVSYSDASKVSELNDFECMTFGELSSVPYSLPSK